MYVYIIDEWKIGEISIEFEVNENGEVSYKQPTYTF